MRREYPETALVAVGALVIDPNRKTILIIKRLAEPSKGKYSIPGGLVELGETAEDAVKREVFEETNIRTELLGIVNVENLIEKDPDGRIHWHYIIIDFLARPLTYNIEAKDDASEAFWYPISRVLELDLTSHTRSLLEKILARKSICYLANGECHTLKI